MKVLVTGATGFLGLRTCEILKKDFNHLIGLGRNEKKGRELLNRGIPFLKADLTDYEKMENIVKDFDHIVHCGGLSSPWGKRRDFLDINYKAASKLAHLAQKYKIKKFILISSPSVYHSSKDLLDIKESDPITSRPINYYIESKVKAEKGVLENFPNAIILRPRAIIGPGDEAIFPRLIKANEKGRLRTIGKGNNLTDLTYIDNAVEAIRCALLSKKVANGQVFNISDGDPKKLWSLIDHVFTQLGLKRDPKLISYHFVYSYCYLSEIVHKFFLNNKEPVLTRYTCNLFAKSQTLNISKAKKILGYTPKVKTMEGIEKFIDHYKAK
tara:strand:- start:813 stop:1790 length:978 start_codon:yes stop_codon:yes gene_type:complete